MNWMVPHHGGCEGHSTDRWTCENPQCSYQGEEREARTGPDDPGFDFLDEIPTNPPKGAQTLAEQCWRALRANSADGDHSFIDIIQRYIDLAVSEAEQMNIHCLKTWPEPFEALWEGLKTYEYRRDDRDFQVGDELVLQEWDPETEEYSGRSLKAKVQYMSRGPDWGIPDGYCCMSIRAYARRP